ncbi:sphinganine C4-monooxygenase protein [Dioscorea alata]|uniref:Sphinganine C4-monooxygenase protein n=1 Tax=Dioscorea alata TaxID=55571 RepID=A0ACB7TSQ5_DIOAL|nr:sphinganine C4-monooxygenase protein [Dioscorea alata]
MDEFFSSDEFMVMFVPIIVYWVYSGLYEMLGSLDNYRLHSRRDEETKNLVSKLDVFKGVLFQQSLQAATTFLIFKLTHDPNQSKTNSTSTSSSFLTLARQIFVAMFVLDSWQYMVHRCMHSNKFLYRNFHSWHHRIVAPYAFAAQYNHPLDGFLTEALSGAMAFFISGMSARTSIFFFSFTTIKGIDDHCGLVFPWNPFQLLFSNNTAYHDVHHQLSGSKCNFSQPFFVVWDKVLGTYAPYSIKKREGGGYEARVLKSCDN